jgi:hypothetical protein
MLLTLPYQSLDITKLQIRPFSFDKKGRRIAPILYQEGSVMLNDLAMLLPPLTLIKYDASTNRLQLDTNKERLFGSKWTALQTKIAETLYVNTNSVFSRAYALEEIQMMIHSLFQSHCFTVYVFPTTLVQIADGTNRPITEVPAGSQIRCVLRVHGLMMVDYRGTPSVRIQHSIPSLSMCDS